MATNALPIRFTELLQVRLMANWAYLVYREHQLTDRCVQLTHTEIDVRLSQLQFTLDPLPGHTDCKIAKIHRFQFMCECHT